ncbi:MAG TPA: oligosaccharide flippase family protein [Actinomycetota bacterium]|nr:oligosaccharide flippase family protein [Actinomycetota bacterium]
MTESPTPDPAGVAAGGRSLTGLLGWNLRALGLAHVAGKVAGLLSMVVLARGLGEVDFGRYTAAIALVQLLIVVVEFGTSGYLVREGAQRPEALGTVLGHVLMLRALLGALAAGVAVPIGAALGYDSRTVVAVALFAVAAGFRIAGAAFVSALQSLERLGDVARMQAEIALAQAVAAAAVVVAGGDVVAVSWAIVAVSAAYPVRTWLVLRRRWDGRVTPGVAGFGAMIRVAGFFAIAAGLTTTLTFLDAIMVQAFRGNAATGLYGAAYRVLIALGIAPVVYTEAANRSIAFLARHDPPRLARMVRRILRHLLLLALPLAAGGVVLAGELLETLYGGGYRDASGALSILLAALVFVFPGYLLVATCYAVGLERRVALTLALAVLLNAAANLVAIPRLGIEGAAAATLGAEAIVFALHAWFLHGVGLRLELGRALAKPALAAAAMTAAVWPLRALPTAIPLAAGALVYVVCLLALRAFDADDRTALKAIFTRRSPGAAPAPHEREP